MTRKQFYRAVFVFSTAIGLLLLVILITLLTKDEWPNFGIFEVVFLVLLLGLYPAMGGFGIRYGIWLEQNRPRERIENVNTYQIEPHGIRYSQHRREG